MGKIAKNLFLDPDVIERGAAYGRQHGVTLSRLVSDFLRALPLDTPASPIAPAVQRLLGAALPKGSHEDDSPGDGRQDYHEHLAKKYGSR